MQCCEHCEEEVTTVKSLISYWVWKQVARNTFFCYDCMYYGIFDIHLSLLLILLYDCRYLWRHTGPTLLMVYLTSMHKVPRLILHWQGVWMTHQLPSLVSLHNMHALRECSLITSRSNQHVWGTRHENRLWWAWPRLPQLYFSGHLCGDLCSWVLIILYICIHLWCLEPLACPKEISHNFFSSFIAYILKIEAR